MTATETARAVYEEIAAADERSACELTQELIVVANDIREGTLDHRQEIAGLLEGAPSKDMRTIATTLDQTAGDLRQVFGSASPTMKVLPGNTAGQAPLGGSVQDVMMDPLKMEAQEGVTIIDVDMAQDILAHEEEHTKQSATPDAQEIHVDSHTFDQRKVWEAGAISIQADTGFLSDEYQQIHADLPLDEQGRLLVREGRFKDLERKLNGREHATAA
ncbi:MAG: hypothetical protein PHH13_00510 [Candidatus Peribacteraceae bacterium]|nr:hypothetical protein [Candidatus Peribacteraceae bacterium]